MFRTIVKRHAMTGSGLGRYEETRPTPGFRDGWGPGRKISRSNIFRKIFYRIFLKKMFYPDLA